MNLFYCEVMRGLYRRGYTVNVISELLLELYGVRYTPDVIKKVVE